MKTAKIKPPEDISALTNWWGFNGQVILLAILSVV